MAEGSTSPEQPPNGEGMSPMRRDEAAMAPYVDETVPVELSTVPEQLTSGGRRVVKDVMGHRYITESGKPFGKPASENVPLLVRYMAAVADSFRRLVEAPPRSVKRSLLDDLNEAHKARTGTALTHSSPPTGESPAEETDK